MTPGRPSSPTLRRVGLWAACGLCVLYSVLVVLAAYCPPDAATARSPHHHHGQIHHSTLCAWACQVVSTSALQSVTQTAGAPLRCVIAAAREQAVPDRPSNLLAVPRGPPQHSFAL